MNKICLDKYKIQVLTSLIVVKPQSHLYLFNREVQIAPKPRTDTAQYIGIFFCTASVDLPFTLRQTGWSPALDVPHVGAVKNRSLICTDGNY